MFTPIGFYAAAAGGGFGGVTDGLQMSFEAKEGSSFTDTSGNGITFTRSAETNGGIQHLSPDTGSSWFFNASTTVDTNYVDTSYVPGNMTNGWSVCFIARWDVPNPSQTNQGFVWSAYDTWPSDGFVAWYNPFSENFVKQTQLLNGSEAEHEHDAGSSLRHKWLMLSQTHNGTTLKQYVNGTEVSSLGLLATPNVSSTMKIHYMPQGANSYDMQIGAFAFYNKTLSGAEITTNYTYFQNDYTGL